MSSILAGSAYKSKDGSLTSKDNASLMKIILSVLSFFITLTVISPAYAVYDPHDVPNNQFGIHVVDPTDLSGVTDLLNSSGGEWGYVKFVIPETDRNTDKWNNIFRDLRRKKLIPIVRLATQSKNSAWMIPTEESLRDWPAFLNSLSWPTENRYVILFNEPNHAEEWGHTIDPEGFARVTIDLAKKLKATSSDFFILPAGLDASAPNWGDTIDEQEFLKRAVASHPDYLTVIDGWTSHSYPNPGFSASPSNSGKISLRTYEWELSLLSNLGLKKKLPVLIGETGWIHSEGERYNPKLLSVETVSSYIKTAGQTVWKDSRIFAITPFIYNYQTPPFDHFSWKTIGGSGHYPMYDSYREIPKTKGKPKQRESYKVLNAPLPEKLVAGSMYQFPIELKNTGQAIISTKDKYFLYFEDDLSKFHFEVDAIPELEPDSTARLMMGVQTPEKIGTYTVKVRIRHFEETFELTSGTVTVIPPPSLRIEAQLGWRNSSNASDVKVIIYDGNELIYEFKDLTVENGVIQTPGILGIVPGQFYRIVTIVPYYLPRQSIQAVSGRVTTILNNRFLPLDTNNDHKVDFDDLILMLKTQPSEILPRFFGT